MKSDKPRVPPLPESQWDTETREILEGIKRSGQVFNIFTTLARHPKLMTKWLGFGNYILFKSTLPARDRELAILRTAWLCRADYEWGHHAAIGRESGLTPEEIERIAKTPDSAGWDPFDATLLNAVDELHNRAVLSDGIWQALGERYEMEQLMDLVFTVGQYHLAAMALNTFGVQLEEGFTGIPE